MKVAIIGSSGYIGPHLVTALQDRHELRLCDILPFDPDRVPWVYTALELERKPANLPPSFGRSPLHAGRHHGF